MAVLQAAGPESRGAVRHGSALRRVARFPGIETHVLTGTTNWPFSTLLVPGLLAPCAMGPWSGALRTSSRTTSPRPHRHHQLAARHAAGPESCGAVRHGSAVRRVARFLTDDKPTSSVSPSVTSRHVGASRSSDAARQGAQHRNRRPRPRRRGRLPVHQAAGTGSCGAARHLTPRVGQGSSCSRRLCRPGFAPHPPGLRSALA